MTERFVVVCKSRAGCLKEITTRDRAVAIAEAHRMYAKHNVEMYAYHTTVAV